jgi:hemerythrin
MFEWKSEYSVRLPEIDAQHQRLFALASELHVAMSQGKGKTVLEPALARLIEYTKVHFADEEKLMRRYNYPDSDAHKILHDQLTAKVLDFQDRFVHQEACLTVDLMEFLQNWLAHHINGSDQKYSADLRGKGAA